MASSIQDYTSQFIITLLSELLLRSNELLLSIYPTNNSAQRLLQTAHLLTEPSALYAPRFITHYPYAARAIVASPYYIRDILAGAEK
jgi:hypothetical protein